MARKSNAKKHPPGGPARITLGVTDERIAAIPRSLQAPTRFIGRYSLPIVSDVAGGLSWASPGTGFQYQSLTAVLQLTQVWTDILGGGYDQFYVDSFSIRWVPYNRYSKVTTASGPFVLIYDVESTALAVPEKDALDYATAKVLSLDDPAELAYQVPRDNTGGFEWHDIAVPSTFLGCLMLAQPPANASSASTFYGQVYWEFSIMARGRK